MSMSMWRDGDINRQCYVVYFDAKLKIQAGGYNRRLYEVTPIPSLPHPLSISKKSNNNNSTVVIVGIERQLII